VTLNGQPFWLDCKDCITLQGVGVKVDFCKYPATGCSWDTYNDGNTNCCLPSIAGGGDCNWARRDCEAAGGIYYDGCCDRDGESPILVDVAGDGFALVASLRAPTSYA
jgi:hypothetical protein